MSMLYAVWDEARDLARHVHVVAPSRGLVVTGHCVDTTCPQWPRCDEFLWRRGAKRAAPCLRPSGHNGAHRFGRIALAKAEGK